MASPFPGMDPWLENPAIFPDLHQTVITYLRDALNGLLPQPYFAASGNRVWIEESERRVEPDVNVLRPKGNGAAGVSGGGSVVTAVAEPTEVRPVVVRVPREVVTEWFLEIHAAPGGERLVTAIEVLSPTNKRTGSQGRELYLQKQREVLHGQAHLVEIDLLRSGLHTTAVPLDRARAEAGPFDYHVCVHRYDKPGDYVVYPIRLSQRLPAITVPLLPGTPDIRVPLQELIDRCYDNGRYLNRINYHNPPPPPALSDDQAAWARELLTTRGLLPSPASPPARPPGSIS